MVVAGRRRRRHRRSRYTKEENGHKHVSLSIHTLPSRAMVVYYPSRFVHALCVAYILHTHTFRLAGFRIIFVS